jgi:signal transduction histidine kinase
MNAAPSVHKWFMRPRAGDSVERAVVWRIEGDVERVLRGRRAFRERVDHLPVPPCDVDAAELIFGELLSNALRYAKGEVEVRLELVDGKPVLVVRDHGPGISRPVRLAPRDTLAESGRGLAIVAKLAPRLGISRARDGGTVVRAVLPQIAA